MLQLMVTLAESYDETTDEFVTAKVFTIELEHSLASLSKWESREEKVFLGKETKSPEEVLRYIRDMTLTPDVPEYVYSKFSKENFEAVNTYINAAMTATTFREMEPQRPSRELVTAEIIYFWMVSLTIPFECQYWHLNRLITLVKVCNEKNKPTKKNQRMKPGAATRRAELNRARMAQHGTSG